MSDSEEEPSGKHSRTGISEAFCLSSNDDGLDERKVILIVCIFSFQQFGGRGRDGEWMKLLLLCFILFYFFTLNLRLGCHFFRLIVNRAVAQGRRCLWAANF